MKIKEKNAYMLLLLHYIPCKNQNERYNITYCVLDAKTWFPSAKISLDGAKRNK